MDCGTAVAPDLSAARAHDDGNAANVPVGDVVVVDTDFTRLCRMELEDRRLWTIPLAAAGVLAAAAAAVGLARGAGSRAQPG
ncbi:hypothetical protein GGC64_006225 [Mycobacterium sp. OAS707]|uniref:hypothetical protein n=1 Tax=Mycobacterium sp. OAS707 TaxID=2663822 RepID=UPI0019DF1EFC|nr:hypothetical protein [Mycobacterium sp. OAS707]MBE1552138.1 hypothetical protein [Mycobacterium sp. OAS707]